MRGIKYLKGSMACSQRMLQNPVHRDKLMSVFCFNMSKEEIARCRSQTYNGPIHIITNTHDEYCPENKAAIDKLLNSDVVGMDTETKVVFSPPNTQLPTALIQLAVEDVVVLWRLRKNNHYTRKQFPGVVKHILQNKDIKKVGTGTNGDQKGLYEQYQVIITKLFDNQQLAKTLGFHKLGLASLTAQLFGWKISKQKRLSNWEAHQLDSAQISYAATDAWASYKVFKKLASLMQSVNIEPTPLPLTMQTILHEELKKDRQLFRQIDTTLLAAADEKETSIKISPRSDVGNHATIPQKYLDTSVFTLDNEDFPSLVENEIYKDCSSSHIHDRRRHSYDETVQKQSNKCGDLTIQSPYFYHAIRKPP